MLQKIQFYSSISVVYILTVGAIGAMLYSSHLFSDQALASEKQQVAQPLKTSRTTQMISGKPVRIAIASHAIDLPVDVGYYDTASHSWTLSQNHAQFAAITKPANNTTGATFIYGHGTAAVFGKIGENNPPLGTIAQVFANNGKVFSYSLQAISNLKPNETEIFKNSSTGPPRLIIQTCTGIFSEWRTMFTFSFEGVV